MQNSNTLVLTDIQVRKNVVGTETCWRFKFNNRSLAYIIKGNDDNPYWVKFDFNENDEFFCDYKDAENYIREKISNFLKESAHG